MLAHLNKRLKLSHVGCIWSEGIRGTHWEVTATNLIGMRNTGDCNSTWEIRKDTYKNAMLCSTVELGGLWVPTGH